MSASKLNDAESAAFHRNTTLDGRTLAPSERERFLDKYLPTTPNSSSQEPSPARRQKTRTKMKSPSFKTSTKQRKKPLRSFAGSQLHLFICECTAKNTCCQAYQDGTFGPHCCHFDLESRANCCYTHRQYYPFNIRYIRASQEVVQSHMGSHAGRAVLPPSHA